MNSLSEQKIHISLPYSKSKYLKFIWVSLIQKKSFLASNSYSIVDNLLNCISTKYPSTNKPLTYVKINTYFHKTL